MSKFLYQLEGGRDHEIKEVGKRKEEGVKIHQATIREKSGGDR